MLVILEVHLDLFIPHKQTLIGISDPNSYRLKSRYVLFYNTKAFAIY